MGDYSHLSITDRRRLSVFIEMGLSMTEIAKKLSRSRSTLYRELSRNKEPEGYFAGSAQLKTQDRKKEGRRGKLHTNSALHEYIVRALKKGWSPRKKFTIF